MLPAILSFQILTSLDAVCCLLGILVGGFVVYLFIYPRLRRSEASVDAEAARAHALDSERQRLEIEIAGLKPPATRVSELESKAQSDQSTILDLTQKHATAESSLGSCKQQLREVSAELASVRDRLAASETAHATVLSTLSAREEALRDERSQIDQMQGTLKSQFEALAISALNMNSDELIKRADRDLNARKTEIAALVEPITVSITAVSNAAREMETTRATAFGTIEEQLRQSVASASEIAKQAAALKDALKRPNVRGRWGEVQLKICIELAGMEEHCDVEFQETSLTNEDELLRPDMIVRMPGGRKITVDAKTPMDHFLSYIDASTDEERHTALRNHGKTVKGHVSDLAKTDYMQRIAESPDFVVMFLPNESFLAMALEKEPSLMEDALKKKVLIATPGTLIGLLKVVRYGWTDEKTARNVLLIKEEGAKLNGHIMGFLEDFSRLSLALESVNEAFGDSKRKVENGIAKSSLRLSELGVAKAALPKVKKVSARVTSILKAAGADDEEIQMFESQENLALAATAQDAEEEDED